MLNPTTIPARNLQKFYKTIIQSVKTGKRAIVLTTNNQPQAAIVSLEDLEKIHQAKTMQASLDMLKLASDNKENLKDLPSDLRTRANAILYSK